MSVSRINKAYSTALRREFTVDEYLEYLRNNSYARYISSLVCVECGDPIVFADGYKRQYFKHAPSHDGHNYCSLYSGGTEFNSSECKLRRRLLQETDITLNFELRYFLSKWKCYLTIPPFSQSELDEHTRNNTKLIAEAPNYYGVRQEYPLSINTTNLRVGEIRQMGFDDFPSTFNIQIQGKGTTKKISYQFPGFNPSKQLYSNLINQSYSSFGEENYIDLRKIKEFSTKRVSGSVFLGKHYVFFSESQPTSFSSEEATVKQLIFDKDRDFPYNAYDICFNKINENTQTFCLNRSCDLKEDFDALILWPPVQSVGNYKFLNPRHKELLLLTTKDNQRNELRPLNSGGLFVRVSDDDKTLFYLREKTPSNYAKSVAKETKKAAQAINGIGNDCYLYKKGIVLKKINESNFKIGKKDQVVHFITRLSHEIITNGLESSETSDWRGRLLDAMRHSPFDVLLSNVDISKLREIYSKDQLCSDYFDYCQLIGKIQQKVCLLLKEGDYENN